MEPLYRVLADGNGAIVVTPHLGNWDLGAAAIATCGYPVHAITDPFGPPDVDGMIRASRERLGVGVIPIGPASAREALRALRRNEVLLLACDIDKGGSGVPVQFLGQRVVLPAGPANSLSLRTRRQAHPRLRCDADLTDPTSRGSWSHWPNRSRGTVKRGWPG